MKEINKLNGERDMCGVGAEEARDREGKNEQKESRSIHKDIKDIKIKGGQPQSALSQPCRSHCRSVFFVCITVQLRRVFLLSLPSLIPPVSTASSYSLFVFLCSLLLQTRMSWS